MYKALVQQHTPNCQHFTMQEDVFEATHALLQKGEPMRTQAAQHPDSKRCLTKMWCTGSGRKLRTDAKGDVASFGRARLGSAILSHLRLKRRQQMETWRHHQSVVTKKRGKCAFKGCLNIYTIEARKCKRTYNTHHKCEECSTNSACNV